VTLIAAIAIAPPTVRTESPAGSRTFADLTGRSVTVPQEPGRIAVLAPVFDVLATIEACTDRIAGGLKYTIARISESPTGLVCPSLAQTPVVSTSFAPDPEQILKSDPDVVISIRDLASNLDAIGYPGLVRIDYARDRIESRDRIWRMAGRILNRDKDAAQLQDLYRDKMEDLRLQIRHPGERPPRVIEMFGTPGAWRVSGGGYYLSDVLSVLGASYAASGLQHATEVNQEDLFRLDPDVILLEGNFTPDPEALFNDPSWQAVTAVKARRVYKMPSHNQFNEALDLVLATMWLGRILRPDESGSDLIESTQDVYVRVFNRRLSTPQLCSLFEFNANKHSKSYQNIVAGADCRIEPAQNG
jgi:iron complex transport system substrate-binding protein